MTTSSITAEVPRQRGGGAEGPVLEVRDLHVEFKTREGIVKAVNGVNYSVSSGETLAVLGESGSGKSVTAQAIMGILDSPPGGSPRERSSSRGRTSSSSRRASGASCAAPRWR